MAHRQAVEPKENVHVKGIQQALEKMNSEKEKRKGSDFAKTVEKFNRIHANKTLSEEEKLDKTKTWYKQNVNELPEDIKKCLEDVIGPLQNVQAGTKDPTEKTSDEKHSDLEPKQTPSSDPPTGSQAVQHKPEPKPTAKASSPAGSQAVHQKLEDELNSLKRKFDEASSNNKTYAEDVKKKDQEIKKMKNDLELKNNEIEDLKKRRDTENKEHIEQLNNMERALNQYLNEERDQLKARCDQLSASLNAALEDRQSMEENYIKQVQDLQAEVEKEKKEKNRNEKRSCREIEELNERMRNEIRKRDDNIEKLIAERDDLRDRFSKVAGAKLSDQNADIADLSDPNRAMKLSERFGQLYDDEWTNAFEALSDAEKKNSLPPKKAVVLLLNFLKECVKFCETVRESQVESLKNVFLHPVQNSKLAASGGMQNVQKMTEKPRMASKEEKTLRELRRQVAVQPGVIGEVKQAFIAEVKTWDKEKCFDKKHIEACIPYLQKCVELCWLIVLPDPPLYMKFELKQGDKFDTTMYSVYSASGETYDFLVWPPLLNGEKGGLLSKGVAEPLRKVKKTT